MSALRRRPRPGAPPLHADPPPFPAGAAGIRIAMRRRDRRALAFLPLLSLLTGAACASVPAAGALRERAAAEALAADRRMAAAVAGRDRPAFAALIAADAIFLGSAGPASGREEVVAGWSGYFADGGPRLAWAPDRAEAAEDGGVAFTWGSWSWTPAGGGAPATGRYATVWLRGPGGTLEAALDGSDAPIPESAAAAARSPLRVLSSSGGELRAEVGLLRDGGRPIGHYLQLSRRQREGPGWQAEAGALWPAR